MIKLIDVTDEQVRLRQMIGIVSSAALLASGVSALVAEGSPWLAIPAIVLGFVFVVLAGSLRQRWDVVYKGHDIRFENSPYTGERLFLDGGLVARGGVGKKLEIRAPIRVGDGAGEELVAWVDAGLRRFRLRLYAEGAGESDATLAQARAEAPSTSAPVRQSGVVGSLVVARQVVELLSGIITIIGAIGTLLVWLMR